MSEESPRDLLEETIALLRDAQEERNKLRAKFENGPPRLADAAEALEKVAPTALRLRSTGRR